MRNSKEIKNYQFLDFDYFNYNYENWIFAEKFLQIDILYFYRLSRKLKLGFINKCYWLRVILVVL